MEAAGNDGEIRDSTVKGLCGLDKLLDLSELVSCLSNGLFGVFNELRCAAVPGTVGSASASFLGFQCLAGCLRGPNTRAPGSRARGKAPARRASRWAAPPSARRSEGRRPVCGKGGPRVGGSVSAGPCGAAGRGGVGRARTPPSPRPRADAEPQRPGGPGARGADRGEGLRERTGPRRPRWVGSPAACGCVCGCVPPERPAGTAPGGGVGGCARRSARPPSPWEASGGLGQSARGERVREQPRAASGAGEAGRAGGAPAAGPYPLGGDAAADWRSRAGAGKEILQPGTRAASSVLTHRPQEHCSTDS